MASFQLSKADLAKLPPAVRAMLEGTKARKGGKKKPAEMVKASAAVVGNRFVAVVPVATVSEANQRQWRGRSGRTGTQRAAVSKVLGPALGMLAPFADHYHRGGVLNVTLTRLGGQRLDTLANLGSALKAIEDAVALMLGASDGDPRWKAKAEQEPGGPVGVRIELTAGEVRGG